MNKELWEKVETAAEALEWAADLCEDPGQCSEDAYDLILRAQGAVCELKRALLRSQEKRNEQ